MKTWILDVAERAAVTYLECLLGLLAVAGPLNIKAIELALVAAIPAALSVIKGSMARLVGNRDSASLINL